MTAEEYEEYLNSPHWQRERRGALKRALYRCQVCNTGDVQLEVHHRTYERLGAEKPSDLFVLCENCHDLFSTNGKLAEPDDDDDEWEVEWEDDDDTAIQVYAEEPEVQGRARLVLHECLNHPRLSLGGGSLFLSLAADIAFRLDPLWVVMGFGVSVGLVITGSDLAAGVQKWLIPGSDQDQVALDAEHFAGRLLDGYPVYTNQSALAKLRRLFFIERGEMVDSEIVDGEMVDAAPSPKRALPPMPASRKSPQLNGSPIFPRYGDDVTLRLGQAIDQEALATLIVASERYPNKRGVVPGRRYAPHINGVFGKSMILAGTPGSGKSMLIGLFVEQVGECDVPVIVLDHKGEYTGIAQLSHLSVLIAGGESARRSAEQLGVPYFALSTRNADAFVEMVITQHLQAIVMLPSYGNTWLGKASIVAEVGQALMRYSEDQIEAGKEVLPCLVFLDEAQLYLPERIELLPPEARKNGEVLQNLFNAFFTLATAGRSGGYTIGFATQSLTYIGKWAIKGCQIKVLMRHVEHNDLEMIGKIVGKVASRSEMETMPAGVGVVVGLTPKPMLVQFDTKQSRDTSKTPDIRRLRESREKTLQASRTVSVGDLTLDELVTVLQQKVGPLGKVTQSYEEEEPQSKNVTALPTLPQKERKAEDVDMAYAIQVWNALLPSIKDMEQIFGLKNNQARLLREKIVKMAEARRPDSQASE